MADAEMNEKRAKGDRNPSHCVEDSSTQYPDLSGKELNNVDKEVGIDHSNYKSEDENQHKYKYAGKLVLILGAALVPGKEENYGTD